MSANVSKPSRARWGLAVVVLVSWLAFASTGCQGPRAYQIALQECEEENRNLEDQYFWLENRYRKQQDELARLRAKLGEPEPEPDEFDSYLPGSYYDPAPSQVTAREGRSSSPQRGSRNVTDPSINLPSESLTPDQFMALLEGGDLNASPPPSGAENEHRIADASSSSMNGNPANEAPRPLAGPGDFQFDLPDSEDEAVAGRDPNPSFVDPLAELPDTDTSPSLSRIGSSRSFSPDGANSLAVNPIGVGRQGRLNQDGGSRIETMRNAGSPSGHSLSNIVDHVTTHLVIDPLLTRGKDFDGADGDDGIAVVFETRNASDLFVAQPGRVLISLIDPEEEGEAQRVGMWEFSREEIANRLHDGPNQGRGITLNLTWPKAAPRHRQLKVFVRFENAQGDLLESQGDVSIAIPGDGKTGWSVRMDSSPSSRTRQSRSVADDNDTRALPTPRLPSDSSGAARLGMPATSNPTFPGASAPNTDTARPQWRPYR